jgi:hypothetical protein
MSAGWILTSGVTYATFEQFGKTPVDSERLLRLAKKWRNLSRYLLQYWI